MLPRLNKRFFRRQETLKGCDLFTALKVFSSICRNGQDFEVIQWPKSKNYF